MPRIVAGAARGRRLAVRPGLRTRPTSDRAREGLFSSLGTLADLAGARVLDLYAGSGAVGLEALSRGAAAAVLVEADPRAAATVRANAAVVGLPGAVVVADRVERVLAVAPADGFDVVTADPPYDLGEDDLAAVLAALTANGWARPGAVLVVERASRGPGPAWPGGVRPLRSRRYGEATLWYGRAP